MTRAATGGRAGIAGLSITTPVCQTVQPLPEGDRYLGFLFAEGATHQGVEEAPRAARRRLRVVIGCVVGPRG